LHEKANKILPTENVDPVVDQSDAADDTKTQATRAPEGSDKFLGGEFFGMLTAKLGTARARTTFISVLKSWVAANFKRLKSIKKETLEHAYAVQKWMTNLKAVHVGWQKEDGKNYRKWGLRRMQFNKNAKSRVLGIMKENLSTFLYSDFLRIFYSDLWRKMFEMRIDKSRIFKVDLACISLPGVSQKEIQEMSTKAQNKFSDMIHLEASLCKRIVKDLIKYAHDMANVVSQDLNADGTSLMGSVGSVYSGALANILNHFDSLVQGLVSSLDSLQTCCDNFNLCALDDLSKKKITWKGALHLAGSIAITGEGCLSNLNLAGNCVGNAGLISLSVALAFSKSMRVLDLASNSIGDVGIKALVNQSKDNLLPLYTLESLNLSENDVTQKGTDRLLSANFVILAPKLKTLYLSRNCISHQRIEKIASLLSTMGKDHPRQTLSLENQCPLFHEEDDKNAANTHQFLVQQGTRQAHTTSDSITDSVVMSFVLIEFFLFLPNPQAVVFAPEIPEITFQSVLLQYCEPLQSEPKNKRIQSLIDDNPSYVDKRRLARAEWDSTPSRQVRANAIQKLKTEWQNSGKPLTHLNRYELQVESEKALQVLVACSKRMRSRDAAYYLSDVQYTSSLHESLQDRQQCIDDFNENVACVLFKSLRSEIGGQKAETRKTEDIANDIVATELQCRALGRIMEHQRYLWEDKVYTDNLTMERRVNFTAKFTVAWIGEILCETAICKKVAGSISTSCKEELYERVVHVLQQDTRVLERRDLEERALKLFEEDKKSSRENVMKTTVDSGTSNFSGASSKLHDFCAKPASTEAEVIAPFEKTAGLKTVWANSKSLRTEWDFAAVAAGRECRDTYSQTFPRGTSNYWREVGWLASLVASSVLPRALKLSETMLNRWHERWKETEDFNTKSAAEHFEAVKIKTKEIYAEKRTEIKQAHALCPGRRAQVWDEDINDPCKLVKTFYYVGSEIGTDTARALEKLAWYLETFRMLQCVIVAITELTNNVNDKGSPVKFGNDLFGPVCGAGCTDRHGGDGLCLVCGNDWGGHTGHTCHTCDFVGSRGLWMTKLSSGSVTYYCGQTRQIDGFDGSCGPSNDPQCASCLRFQTSCEGLRKKTLDAIVQDVKAHCSNDNQWMTSFRNDLDQPFLCENPVHLANTRLKVVRQHVADFFQLDATGECIQSDTLQSLINEAVKVSNNCKLVATLNRTLAFDVYLSQSVNQLVLPTALSAHAPVTNRKVAFTRQSHMNPPEASRFYLSVKNDDVPGRRHARSCLDSPQGWSPASNTDGAWIEMNLGEATTMSGIVTQGCSGKGGLGHEHVSKFQIELRDPAQAIVLSNNTRFQIFECSGGDEKHEILFPSPIRAQFVKITVVEWHTNTSMRVGLIKEACHKEEGEIVLTHNADGKHQCLVAYAGETKWLQSDKLVDVNALYSMTRMKARYEAKTTKLKGLYRESGAQAKTNEASVAAIALWHKEWGL